MTKYATPFIASLARTYADDESAGPFRAKLAALSQRPGADADDVNFAAAKLLAAHGREHRPKREAVERETLRALFAERAKGGGRDVDAEIAHATIASRAILAAAAKASGSTDADVDEPSDPTARKIIRAHEKAHATAGLEPTDPLVTAIVRADRKRRGEEV